MSKKNFLESSKGGLVKNVATMINIETENWEKFRGLSASTRITMGELTPLILKRFVEKYEEKYGKTKPIPEITPNMLNEIVD